MIQKEYVHTSFCTGIGACELAAMWMGWRNAFSCEIDPFCHQVLKYYYPHIKHYENIFGTDFSEWRGKIDILTAGFPCQPFSCAGSRKGAEDDRYLWPEVLRGVDEIRPNWFIGENVAGITSMVLPGDEIKVGSYTDLEGESYLETEMRQQFIVDRICNDLESIGYSVQPIIIPACAVGAPHRRDRIWFIANCSNARPEGMQQGENGIYEFEVTANTDKELLEGRDAQRPQRRENQEFTIKSFNCSSCWENFPSQSPVCCGDDGLPSQLSGITFSKHRAESIKAYGNSMVPQLVYQIFKAIGEVENLLKLNQNKKT
jgi:DNA (cytosine-5)-methyltransferase 1